MFTKNTVAEAADTVGGAAPVDPPELVTLAELAAEGFGPWDSLYTKGPRDVIEALARQLDGEVVLDDIGRRCVTRDTARRLFAERDQGERRQREAQERREAELAELAANNPVRGGVPADRIPDGVLPTAAMLQAAKDAEPRRRSVLEEALANRDGLVYHPLSDREAP
jgi:hypothetical protein